MNKLLTFILIGLFLFSLTSVSAFWADSKFELDNSKQIEKQDTITNYGKYTFTEHAWYDILKIWTETKTKEVILEENTKECSNDCLAIKEVTNLKPMPLIEDVRFYRDFGDGKWIEWNSFVNWRMEVEEDIDLFETSCKDGKTIFDEKNGTSYTEQICSQVKTGTEKRWLPLDYEKDYNGTYKVKLSGGKKPSTKLDWQVKMDGVWSEEWAVWGAVIGVGGVEASVTLNAPTDEEIMLTNLVTTNATANVTGGAYLTNATLFDNSTGTWEARNTSFFPSLEPYNLSELTTTTNSYHQPISSPENFFDSNPSTSGGSYSTSEEDTHFSFTRIGKNVSDYRNIQKVFVKASSGTTSGGFVSYEQSIILVKRLKNGTLKSIQILASSEDALVLSFEGNVTLSEEDSEDFSEIYVSMASITEFGVPTYYNHIYSQMEIYGSKESDDITFENNYNSGETILWGIESCDSDGDCGFSTENRTFSMDGTAPTIEASLNPEIFYDIDFWEDNITLTYNITDINLDSCWYRYNDTNVSLNCSNNEINISTISPNYNLTIYANDSVGNNAIPIQLNFTLDSTAPTINLSYPVLVDYAKLNTTLQLNLTAEDSNLDSVWYDYNGTNVTIAGAVSGVYNQSNITLSTKKNVTIYANDTAGNLYSEVFEWDYKVFETTFIYNEETRAGDQEDYSLQLTLYPGYDLTSATFHFDGLTASPSIFSSGNNRVLNVTDYTIPTYTIDTNVSLWWDLVLDDATEITTENSTQLVKAIFLDNCSSYSNVMFNISLLDEVAQTPLNGDIQFYYSLLNVPAYQVISSANLSLTNRSNFAICSDENLTNQNYVQSIEIRYVSDGYAPELYHIQRAEISPEVVNINLYDLNSSEATEFKLTYQDDSFNFVEGAVIQLMRRYISENAFKVVEAPLTSSEGIAVVHVDLDSIKYKAVVVKNGENLDTFDNLVFKCQSELTGECELKLLGNIDPQNTRDYDTERDFTYSITSLNDSISITYSIPSSSPASVNLVLTQKDEWGNTTSCNKTVLSSGGSIECEYDETLGVSYLELSINKDGTPIAYNTYVLEPSSGMDFLDNNYIIVVILMLSLVGMALASPEWIVINGILTMLLAGMLWLVNGISFVAGLGLLMWLVIAAGILILKLAKQEDK